MSRLTLVFLMHFAATMPVLGADNLELQGSVERITSDDWVITGFDSNLELSDAGLGGEFHIAQIILTETGQAFDDIRIECEVIGLTTRNINCERAALTATLPGLGRQTLAGAFSYDRRTSNTHIQLSDVSIAGGRAQFDIHTTEAGIDVRFSGVGLQLAGLLELAGEFSDAFSAYSASGITDVSGTLNAPTDGSPHIVLAADIDEVSLANDDGTIATDGVRGKLDLDLTFDAASTTANLTFNSNQGEAYMEPVYANFSAHAFHLRAEEIVTPDFAFFDVRHFNVQQESLLDASGSATLAFPAEPDAPVMMTADVELRDSSVNNLYTSLVQVGYAGTMLGDLDTDGRLTGSISITDNSIDSATLKLDNLILDDRQGRFAIYGLQGTVDWNADEDRPPADFGGTAAPFTTSFSEAAKRMSSSVTTISNSWRRYELPPWVGRC
jgi:hypothetical protein